MGLHQERLFVSAACGRLNRAPKLVCFCDFHVICCKYLFIGKEILFFFTEIYRGSVEYLVVFQHNISILLWNISSILRQAM